jgi:hypothetical protein
MKLTYNNVKYRKIRFLIYTQAIYKIRAKQRFWVSHDINVNVRNPVENSLTNVNLINYEV